MESLESKIAVLSISVDNLARTAQEGNRVTGELKEAVDELKIHTAVAAAEAKTYGPRLTAVEDWKAQQIGFQRAIWWLAGMVGALMGSIAAAIITVWIKGK